MTTITTTYPITSDDEFEISDLTPELGDTFRPMDVIRHVMSWATTPQAETTLLTLEGGAAKVMRDAGAARSDSDHRGGRGSLKGYAAELDRIVVAETVDTDTYASVQFADGDIYTCTIS